MTGKGLASETMKKNDLAKIKGEIARLQECSPPEPAINKSSRAWFEEIQAHQIAMRVFMRRIVSSLGHEGPMEYSRCVTDRATSDRTKSTENKKKFILEKLRPIVLIASLCGIAGVTKDLSAQEATATSAPKNGEVFGSRDIVDQKRADDFLGNLSNTSIDERKTTNAKRSEIKSVLDIRIPQLIKACPSEVSLEMTLQAYAYISEIPGGEAQLKRTVSVIERKGQSEMRALSEGCSSLLRAMSVSIMRVYLGQDWGKERADTPSGSN